MPSVPVSPTSRNGSPPPTVPGDEGAAAGAAAGRAKDEVGGFSTAGRGRTLAHETGATPSAAPCMGRLSRTTNDLGPGKREIHEPITTSPFPDVVRAALDSPGVGQHRSVLEALKDVGARGAKACLEGIDAEIDRQMQAELQGRGVGLGACSRIVLRQTFFDQFGAPHALLLMQRIEQEQYDRTVPLQIDGWVGSLSRSLRERTSASPDLLKRAARTPTEAADFVRMSNCLRRDILRKAVANKKLPLRSVLGRTDGRWSSAAFFRGLSLPDGRSRVHRRMKTTPKEKANFGIMDGVLPLYNHQLKAIDIASVRGEADQLGFTVPASTVSWTSNVGTALSFARGFGAISVMETPGFVSTADLKPAQRLSREVWGLGGTPIEQSFIPFENAFLDGEKICLKEDGAYFRLDGRSPTPLPEDYEPPPHAARALADGAELRARFDSDGNPQAMFWISKDGTRSFDGSVWQDANALAQRLGSSTPIYVDALTGAYEEKVAIDGETVRSGVRNGECEAVVFENYSHQTMCDVYFAQTSRTMTNPAVPGTSYDVTRCKITASELSPRFREAHAEAIMGRKGVYLDPVARFFLESAIAFRDSAERPERAFIHDASTQTVTLLGADDEVLWTGPSASPALLQILKGEPQNETRAATGVEVLANPWHHVDDYGARRAQELRPVEHIHGVTFTDTELKTHHNGERSFAGATIERTDFRRCNLQAADFSETTQSYVRYTNADLSGASFADARLFFVDFRGSHLDKAKLKAEVKSMDERTEALLDSM